jgi:effector-binding domain-containing protein
LDSNVSEVQHKSVDPILIAAIRMTGKYSDAGNGFSLLGRKFGRHICGHAMMLHHDSEYKENDANYEVCMPVRKGESTENIEVRELTGGQCISLIHTGPYNQIGPAYEKITEFAQQHKHQITLPTREVYLKGPGMIFKGNPQKYVTEIQMLIANSKNLRHD